MINKFPTLSILILLSMSALGQTGSVKGIVVNARTAEALPFATVFINYTTLWTSANEKGEFILANIPLGQHELAATFVGHQSFQTTVNLRDSVTRYVVIKLHSNPLREVQIRSTRDKEWNRQYDRFKRLFLGNSSYASRCTILNPWSLEFRTDKEGFFVATSPEVLEIENRSLGYKMYYQLKNFSYGPANFTISGNVRFEYMETLDSTLSNAWPINRQEAYEGSVRHLLRSLVDSALTIEGFALYKDETSQKHILRQSDLEANVGKGITYLPQVQLEEVSPNNFKVYLPARLEVHYLNQVAYAKIYRNVNHPVSWLEVSGGYLFVNGMGIVLNPSKLVLSGKMSEARIAELLPYDFQAGRRDLLKKKPREFKKDEVNSLSFLIEKPYLHTDKSSYYPNEMLWFRGYMNYANPLVRDSLSKILYVDLIDHNKSVISRKILPIVDGATVGNLMIPGGIVPGDYVLRAYTRWLFNFDESLVFLKPIKILTHRQVVKQRSEYAYNDSTSMLTVMSNKEVFQPREKIIIRLSVKDDLELLQPGNFSVSVTDIKQAAPAQNEGSILTDFQIGNVSISSEVIGSGKYPVQRGIEFKGQLFTKKGKPTQGTLILEQENSGGQFTITTGDNGIFTFHDLQLYDTSRLFVLPQTNKGLIGKLVIDSSTVTPFSHPVDSLKLDVIESENPSQYNSWQSFSNARMLREVVIHDTRLQEEPARGSISKPDYFITGESLRASHTTDIISAIQSKVPGMRVIGGTIVLGAIGTFGNPEALVLIDGMAINGNLGAGAPHDDLSSSTLERISSLTAQEIERIEVIKYSGTSAYGSRGANGVISITTRQPGDVQSPVPKRGKFQEIKFPRLSPTSEFYAPDYARSGVNPATDYRSTIFWNPYVKTDENNVAEVSFYAAELPTQYRIVVEGILRDGRVVHAEKIVGIADNP